MHSSRMHTACLLAVSHSAWGEEVCSTLLDADPLPLDADPRDHVTCIACWEANHTVNRMTHRCETLPCPKLRLWAVIMIAEAW